jgi:hypothetical protein
MAKTVHAFDPSKVEEKNDSASGKFLLSLQGRCPRARASAPVTRMERQRWQRLRRTRTLRLRHGENTKN